MSNALNQVSIPPIELPLANNPAVDAYLAEVSAYLTGVVPDDERDNFLEETLDHLESMIERSAENSISTEVATIVAFEAFGSARKNAETLIEAWQNSQPQHESLIIRRFGLANAYAFGFFGCTDLAYWILLQIRVYLPTQAGIHMPWSPALIRHYFPEPLPFPDFSFQFILVSVFPVLAPFVIGWLCGRKIAVRPQSTVYGVLMPIILSSFLIGLILLPTTEGLVFAVFQTVFWLPVGCFMAYLSSSLAWRSRRRKFGRVAVTHPPERTS